MLNYRYPEKKESKRTRPREANEEGRSRTGSFRPDVWVFGAITLELMVLEWLRLIWVAHIKN